MNTSIQKFPCDFFSKRPVNYPLIKFFSIFAPEGQWIPENEFFKELPFSAKQGGTDVIVDFDRGELVAGF